MLTPRVVAQRVLDVAQAADAGDYERAASLEYDLLCDVLYTIQHQHPQRRAQNLARVARMAVEIDFPRWHA